MPGYIAGPVAQYYYTVYSGLLFQMWLGSYDAMKLIFASYETTVVMVDNFMYVNTLGFTFLQFQLYQWSGTKTDFGCIS